MITTAELRAECRYEAMGGHACDAGLAADGCMPCRAADALDAKDREIAELKATINRMIDEAHDLSVRLEQSRADLDGSERERERIARIKCACATCGCELNCHECAGA